jgi:hypothetical protein
MRPPPTGARPQTVRASALQARTIISRTAGRNGGIGPSEVDCVAGSVAGGVAGATAARFGCGAGRVFLLVAGAVGALGAVAVDGWVVGAAGGVAGDAAGAAGSVGAAVAAGAGAGVAAGGAAGAAAGAAGGVTALTAAWQPGDSCAMCSFRQRSASAPPGRTPEQFDMKSDRQLERIALICACVGCCASAGPLTAISARATIVRSRRSVICPVPGCREAESLTPDRRSANARRPRPFPQARHAFAAFSYCATSGKRRYIVQP